MVDTADVAGGRAGALPARRRFTVDEYYRMAEAGILGPDERVELLDGEIIEMAAIGTRHATCVRLLDGWFQKNLAGRAIVSCQMPVRLSSRAEPEPDIALLRPRPDQYGSGHPGPGDVLLMIEVADTSLGYDHDRKLPRYAEAGIPEVWLADLTHDQVLVHSDPAGGRYQTARVARRGDTLAPAAFPDLFVPIADVLPPSAPAHPC